MLRLQFEQSRSANGAKRRQCFCQGGIVVNFFNRFSTLPPESQQKIGAVDFDMLLQQRRHTSAALISGIAFMAGAEVKKIDEARGDRERQTRTIFLQILFDSRTQV